MEVQEPAAEVVATSDGGISTAQEAGSNERGVAIITPSSLPVPAQIVADMAAGAQRIVDEINTEHRLAQSSYAEHAIRCGQLLIEQRQRVGYGNFGAWILFNCEFARSTATRYMTAAKRFATGVAISNVSAVFPSGRAPRTQTIDAEQSAPVRDSRTAKTPEELRIIEGDSGLMTGARVSPVPQESRQISVDLAVKALKADVRDRGDYVHPPRCVGLLSHRRGEVTRARDALARAQQELERVERDVLAAYKALKVGKP